MERNHGIVRNLVRQGAMKSLAMVLIGASIASAGCEQRKEDPTAIEKAEVPAVPVIPPGKVGAPEGGQGLATPPTPEGLPGERAVPGIDTTVADIMKRPDLYAGRVVTIVSEVDEIFTGWAFKLDDSQAPGGIDNDLLVVGAIPLAGWGFDESWKGKKVKVTGTIRILQPEDIQREYGRGVDDKLFRRYVDKPTLVARTVEKAG